MLAVSIEKFHKIGEKGFAIVRNTSGKDYGEGEIIKIEAISKNGFEMSRKAAVKAISYVPIKYSDNKAELLTLVRA